MANGKKEKAPRPLLLSAVSNLNLETQPLLARVANPIPSGTIGDIGLATRVSRLPELAPFTLAESIAAATTPAAIEFPSMVLNQPYDARNLVGIDHKTVRVFRYDSKLRSLRPVWNSGINRGLKLVWANVSEPGTYVPIGLPQDPLLRESLRELSRQRRLANPGILESQDATTTKAFTESALAAFLEMPLDELFELRRLLTLIETVHGARSYKTAEIRRGEGAGVMPFPLPGGLSVEEFRERLRNLEVPLAGLPEEALFFPPEVPGAPELLPPQEPTQVSAPPQKAEMLDELFAGTRLDPVFRETLRQFERTAVVTPFRLAVSDWWMFHHDEEHSGRASGTSGITSTTVGRMTLRHVVNVGSVISVPSIVAGKIYVGRGNQPGGGGTLFKIDLVSGNIERQFRFRTPVGGESRQGYSGIGSSPAVTGGRVYFSGLDGRFYCLDANTLDLVWVTNLRQPDAAHNQPVRYRVPAEGWSSPLVVNDKIYVGFGEGESNTFGFVYCLDAGTGNVIWLFCTNQFAAGTENRPNVIPASLVGINPLPAGYSALPDPPFRGCSPWSSCAYDATLNRIYIGTGNSVPDNPLPDPRYASGIISLDADTGEFRGFFQPASTDSYRADDDDVDVPAGPTLFMRNAQRVLAFGSKNGSFFLLDPDTMTPLRRRQLLPKAGGNGGFPGDTGALLPDVDPHIERDENFSGVFGSAAVHSELGRIFVGLGGYAFDTSAGIFGIDSATTPFVRALDWDTLRDAWPTTVGPDGVARYTTAQPLYQTVGEAALSSPAVVNDVVLVTTMRPGLYAFDARTGNCPWRAEELDNLEGGTYIFGPAVYSNHIVFGTSTSVNGGALYIYSL